MDRLLLSPEHRASLEWLVEQAPPGKLLHRARCLLCYDQGLPTRETTRLSGLSAGRARFWRRQYLRHGLAIFGAQNFPDPSASPALATSEVPQPLPEPGAGDESQPQQDQPKKPRKEAAIASLDDFLAQARQLTSPGIQPDDLLSEAGRKVWRYHFAQMLLNEEGTRLGEDIEALHDMRVATRRMRAAFEVFEQAFQPKTLKTHLKGLRATGRALGKVRDLDVFIEKAQTYQAKRAGNDHANLSLLLEAWQEKRAAARKELEDFLNSEGYRKFVQNFYEFVSTPGAGAQKLPKGQPTPSLVREITPALIYSRLAAVRAYGAILEQASLEQFHALRIEFKKLRYTLEYFREVLGPEAKQVINDIKGLQDHLGDLNDAQVASQILRDFLLEWDARQAKLPVQERRDPQPVLDYLTYQYQERQRLMQSFYSHWEKFNRPELHANLAMAVSVL